MTLMAAVVEVATGAAARAFAVSVATSFAQSAVLAFLAHALPASPAASPAGRRPGAAQRMGSRVRRRPASARSRRVGPPRAAGRGPDD